MLQLEVRWACSGSLLKVVQAHGKEPVRAVEQQLLPQLGAMALVKLLYGGRVLKASELLGEVVSKDLQVLELVCGRSQLFTASADGSIKVWGTQKGECQASLEGHLCAVTSMALTRDNQRLVSGSEDSTARVWDLETFQCCHVLATWR